MAQRKEISGVYKITNLLNGKVYIGGSLNIIQRLSAHRSALRQRKHISIPASDYLSIDDFAFDVIEKTKIDDIIKTEAFYIKLYNACNPKYGYNKIESTKTGIALQRRLEEVIPLHLSIDSQIHKDIKKLAIDLDRKISDIAEEAFLEYLKKHKAVK